MPLFPSILKNSEINESDYRSVDAVSQSMLRLFQLAPTPFHFYLQNLAPRRPTQQQTPAMALGSLLHRRLELGDSPTYLQEHTVTPKGLRRGTKAHKEFQALHTGKKLICSADWTQVEAMYQSIMKNKAAKILLSGGYPEESFFDRYEDTPVKGRLDYRQEKLKAIVDVKSAITGDPFSKVGFAKTVFSALYDWQAAFYVDAMKRLTGETYAFVFVVVEKTYPYACSLHTLPTLTLPS